MSVSFGTYRAALAVRSRNQREVEMAEHFRGRRLTMHTSNGGARLMLNAWLVLGSRMPRTDDRDAVLAFLRGRLERGEGWKAFNLDPPPEEIASPSRLAAFAQIVVAFARELAKDQPDPSMTDIIWDKERRLMWLANMLDLLEILADHVPPAEDGSLEPALGLTEMDRVRCDVWRTRNRQGEAVRRGAPDETRLELADRMITLLSLLPSDEWRDTQLVAARGDRADLLLDQGDAAGAAAELRLALKVERDPRSRAALSAIINDLSS